MSNPHAIRILFLGSILGLFLALPGLTWAHSCPTTKCGRCIQYIHTTTSVSCNGYTCEKHDCEINEACSDLCCINILYCQAPSPMTTTMNAMVNKVVDVLTQPAYADVACTSSTDSSPCYGYRNSSNMSGVGVAKSCAAKLHVCFIGGIYDSALSGVDTTNECNNTCDTMQSPNQIACAYANCQSRCYAGLVPGYADSCS